VELQRVESSKPNVIATRWDFRRIVRSWPILLLLTGCVLIFTIPAMAQSGLEGRITQTINSLVRIVNILIVGFIVWSGFLIAKGDGSGFQRLIYGIVGLIVANGAYVIINYFNY
jgi:hypothetical protein